jgi:hypothetical protein
VEGWESLLASHIKRAASMTFAWGSNDCALWCADWVKAATGSDFGEDWRDRYSTEEELAELMGRRGFFSVGDIADRNLAPKPLNFARRGDIVLHPLGALGICAGATSYFLMESGITRIGTLRCLKAWEVE